MKKSLCGLSGSTRGTSEVNPFGACVMSPLIGYGGDSYPIEKSLNAKSGIRSAMDQELTSSLIHGSLEELFYHIFSLRTCNV